MSPETPDQTRRRLLTATGGGIALAGCVETPDTAESTPTETLTPVPDEVSETPKVDGEEETSDEADSEAVRIGVLAPMNIPLGEAMWNAARMAAEEINDDDGLGEVELEVLLGDTEVSPGIAESEYRRLVAEEDCDFTVGVFLGSALMQMLPAIADQETIHLTTGAADPRAGRLVSRTNTLTSDSGGEEYDQFKYHFRVGPLHHRARADALVEFVENNAEARGWDSAALLTENLGELTPYAEAIESGLDGVIETPVIERPGGLSGWSPLFNEVEDSDCDVALVSMLLGGTTLVNQWAEQERPFDLGGLHVPSQSFDYWDSTDGNVEGVFSMNALTPQTDNTPETQPFVSRYIQRWDAVPMYTGAVTYDAVHIIGEAIQEVARNEDIEVTESAVLPESDLFVAYLEEMTYTDGVVMDEFAFTGPEADYAHEPDWESMADDGIPVIQQWQHDTDVREDYGTMHAVAPSENATAEFASPEWLD